MPQIFKNYPLLKELLDTYGQTEFLKTHGTIEDIYQIQIAFITSICKYYDTPKYGIQKPPIKLKKE